MGLSIARLSPNYERPANPNPNPLNFEIKEYHQRGDNLIVLVHYPGCTNFEGNKILVLRDTRIPEICARLDPHFCKGSKLITRFVPTWEGLQMALQLCSLLDLSHKSDKEPCRTDLFGEEA